MFRSHLLKTSQSALQLQTSHFPYLQMMDDLTTGSSGFSPVTPNDRAGILWIVTILALIYTSMVAAARVYIKHRMYGLDDILISFSIVRLQTVSRHRPLLEANQTATASRPVRRCLHWPRPRHRQVQLHHAARFMESILKGTPFSTTAFRPRADTTRQQSFLVAELLFTVALAFAKCFLLALILRIIGTKTGRSRPVCFVLIRLAVIWGFAACVALAVDCQTDSLLTTDNETACPRQVSIRNS